MVGFKIKVKRINLTLMPNDRRRRMGEKEIWQPPFANQITMHPNRSKLRPQLMKYQN